MRSFLSFINEKTEPKIKWALTKSHGQDKYNYDDKELVIVSLDVNKVMNHVSSSAIGKDGSGAKAFRMERLDAHIRDGGYLDPPLIGDYERRGVINFGNGRHRFYWAWKHGIRKIPFFVMKSEKDYMLKKYG